MTISQYFPEWNSIRLAKDARFGTMLEEGAFYFDKPVLL